MSTTVSQICTHPEWIEHGGGFKMCTACGHYTEIQMGDKLAEERPTRKIKPKSGKLKSDFWKNYEHPKWQRKRLKIIERDNGICQQCEDTETMLHVDHAYYVSGRMPWEYPDWSLRTLCKKCHKERHVNAGNDEYSGTDWEEALAFFVDGSEWTIDNVYSLALECALVRSEGVPDDELYKAILETVRAMRPAAK